MASSCKNGLPTPKRPVTAPRRQRTPSSLRKELATLRTIRSDDEKRQSHILLMSSADVLKSVNSVFSSKVQVESKVRKIPSKEEVLPHILRLPPPDYETMDTKESLILRDTFRNLFGDKHYAFRMSVALNMSSSAAGIVNSVISNSALTSNPDFVALSGVFNEFFVVSFDVHWMPVARYQYPLTGTSALSVANLPIGKADLQHGAAAYSSLSAMAENFAIRYHSTGDPFSDTWINTEKPTTETVVASLTAPTQSWCTVNNVSNYQGTLQFISQSAPPGLPASQVLGTFMCHWKVLFRVRN